MNVPYLIWSDVRITGLEKERHYPFAIIELNERLIISPCSETGWMETYYPLLGNRVDGNILPPTKLSRKRGKK